MTPEMLTLTPEVADALAKGAPVVALESTIITHGMPYPANLETALAVEGEIRARGAIPATIAVVKGEIKIGLTEAELDALAQDTDCVKASGRDLAVAMVRKASAGTTVSATMRLAALAGIRVFATGGVGGVHRGAEHSWDVSADLTELGATPVTVVCAGVKSILDIPKTLEVLETNRVPVIAYGTDAFPAFFARESGYPADHRLDSATDLAAAIDAHDSLGTGTGVLVANPVPEEDALAPGRDRRHHRRGHRRRRRPGRDPQGADALPAGPHRREKRRPQSEGQYLAGAQQRAPGRRHRGGHVRQVIRNGRRGTLPPVSFRALPGPKNNRNDRPEGPSDRSFP